MTLEQLRIFVAVGERQHVTQAAQALHLTQSAVSGAIAALEARHDVKLFDRIGRSIVLNEVGRTFLAEAKAVLARVEAAEMALADLGSARRGRLTLYASQTIASYWLPKRLVSFHAAHPRVELDIRIGNTQEVAAAVSEGQVELGFVEGAAEGPHLVSEDVGEDRLVLLVRPDHPWAIQERITPAELLEASWVLRERGSGTRATFEAALGLDGEASNGLDVVLTLPSNEAVLAAAEAGAGVTSLSESVAASALARGALVRAPFRLPSRTYRLLRHQERYRTRAGEAFTALARAMKDVIPDDDYAI